LGGSSLTYLRQRVLHRSLWLRALVWLAVLLAVVGLNLLSRAFIPLFFVLTGLSFRLLRLPLSPAGAPVTLVLGQWAIAGWPAPAVRTTAPEWYGFAHCAPLVPPWF